MTGSLPPLVVSPVVREAVELKIEELERAKATCGELYEGNPEIKAAGSDVLKRLNARLDAIKKLDPYLEQDDDPLTLTRYIEQAQNDRSISQSKLLRLEKDLVDKLDKSCNRFEVSSLQVDLMKEALISETSATTLTEQFLKAGLEDYELVEGELEQVYEKFEKNTFAATEVNTKSIEPYLDSLFKNKGAKDQLRRLRSDVERFGNDLIGGDEAIDEEIVIWCIGDLLKNSLLEDKKKKTLQDYLQHPTAIRELTSTLNMKSCYHWTWRNSSKGLPVAARKNEEGTYCITVDEDIIDMLFLHSLAVQWSMKLKEVLKDAVSFKGIWPGNKILDIDELEKREYYLEGTRLNSKSCMTCHGPPPLLPGGGPVEVIPSLRRPRRRGPPLPPPNSKPRRKGRLPCPPPPPPPMLGTPNVNDERYRSYIKNLFLSRLPERNGCSPESVDSRETQAILIKTLVAETKLREALDGSAYGLTANFNSFASSLPHETILAVLKFIGMPQQWLDVFTRFLAAPLNMGPVVRGTSDQILTRTCGVPVAHGLETFFGEAILFFLDLVIHQKTDAYLFRLRDQCYFVGKKQQRDDAQEQVTKFADIMGLNVATSNTLNKALIGFVVLTADEDQPGTGVSHGINDALARAYALRVKKQLSACPTVVEWIRTWNSTVGTYAPHLFGPLANILGKAHVEAVTNVYNRMHEIIFDGGNLTDHITKLLVTHLGRPLSDPPFALEALIYLPHFYGGLGVKNPYITLNLARNVAENPTANLEKFVDGEKRYHEWALENYKRMTPHERDVKLEAIFRNDKARIATVLGADFDPAIFPTLEQVTADRERAAYPCLPPLPYPAPLTLVPLPSLINTYIILLAEPVDHITPSERISDEVSKLQGKLGMKPWYKMSAEEQWAVQMYGDECFERYDGLQCWHGPCVPRDVLKMVRGEEIEYEDEDGSSVSTDMTEA